ARRELFGQELGYVGLMTMAVGIGRTKFRHGQAYQVGAFRENHDGIIIRVTPVFDNQFRQRINVGWYFWDQETISPRDNCCLQSCETRVTPKHTTQYGLAVRAGGGAHASDKLSCSADGRLEADAIIVAGQVVLH